MDNLNISFAPDKSAEDKGRINAVEDYLSLLTERIKFCLNGIDENIAQKSDGEEEKQLIYSTIADEVGQFTNTDKKLRGVQRLRKQCCISVLFSCRRV